MGVGLRIKEILRDRKMTIKKLSELSGVSLNTLYSITKRDSSNVDDVIINKLAPVLGVSAAQIDGSEEWTPSTPPYNGIFRFPKTDYFALDVDKILSEIDDTPENRAALEAANRMIYDLQSNPRQFTKASEDDLQKLGILQFKSEDDRIAYFYSLLNIDGKLAASKCFFRHLSPDVWTEVADYVQNLSTIPQYQKSPSEDNQGNGDQE